MASRYLIDTHVIVEFSVPGGLEAMPAKVRRILENPDVERLFSAVSEVELAIKSRLGKLQLTRDDLTLVYEKTIIKSYPFRREHADRLFDLALHHKDPFRSHDYCHCSRR